MTAMARSKKKNTNPQQSMDQLLKRAAELFEEPYDDRDDREADLPSIRSVADELGTTLLRTRKLLITADMFSTNTSRTVQEMVSDGKSVAEIMEVTGLKKASINSYLPYKNMAFNLDQTTVNADRHRVFRRRIKAVEELKAHLDLPDAQEKFWEALIEFQDYPFKTSGRGKRKGLKFSYKIHGGEMIVDRKVKSITKASIILAFQQARKMGVVKGPKALGGVFGASYLYPLILFLFVQQPYMRILKKAGLQVKMYLDDCALIIRGTEVMRMAEMTSKTFRPKRNTTLPIFTDMK